MFTSRLTHLRGRMLRCNGASPVHISQSTTPACVPLLAADAANNCNWYMNRLNSAAEWLEGCMIIFSVRHTLISLRTALLCFHTPQERSLRGFPCAHVVRHESPPMISLTNAQWCYKFREDLSQDAKDAEESVSATSNRSKSWTHAQCHAYGAQLDEATYSMLLPKLKTSAASVHGNACTHHRIESQSACHGLRM